MEILRTSSRGSGNGNYFSSIVTFNFPANQIVGWHENGQNDTSAVPLRNTQDLAWTRPSGTFQQV